jgi:hypothetical protein
MMLGVHYVRYDTLFHKCVMNRTADKQGRGEENGLLSREGRTVSHRIAP